MPSEKRPDDPAVAVRERVDLGKPVMKPRANGERMANFGVFVVPNYEIVQLAFDLFGRAILVNRAIAPRRVVWKFLEFSPPQLRLEHAPKLIYRLVRRLILCDDLVQGAHEPSGQRARLGDLRVDEVNSVSMVAQYADEVVRGFVRGASLHVLAEETPLDERPRNASVQVVYPLDDSRLDGPASEQLFVELVVCPQIGFFRPSLDLKPLPI